MAADHVANAPWDSNPPAVNRYLDPVFASAEHMTPLEYDRAFDDALGLDHVEGPQTAEQVARLDAARKERRPWKADIPLELLRRGAYPKIMFRGTWSAAFGHVAAVIAESIGAELITIPGGHAVQHRAGFNERVVKAWSENASR